MFQMLQLDLQQQEQEEKDEEEEEASPNILTSRASIPTPRYASPVVLHHLPSSHLSYPLFPVFHHPTIFFDLLISFSASK